MIKHFILLRDSLVLLILLFTGKGENLFSVLEIFLVPPIIVGVGKREREGRTLIILTLEL